MGKTEDFLGVVAFFRSLDFPLTTVTVDRGAFGKKTPCRDLRWPRPIVMMKPETWFVPLGLANHHMAAYLLERFKVGVH